MSRKLTAFAVAVCAALAAIPSAAQAGTPITVVPWLGAPLWHPFNAPGASSIVEGPGAVPMGNGSLKLAAATGPLGNKTPVAEVRSGLFHGLKVADIAKLRYSTHAKYGGVAAAAAVNLVIDTNGDGAFDDTLVYEPYMNGGIAAGYWQRWDAAAGRWWSTHGLAGMPQGAPKPLSTYVAAYPDAQVTNATDDFGGVAIRIGGSSNLANVVGFVDAFTINNVVGGEWTFDFDPLP